MRFKVTNLRLDFIPNPRISDLDSGKAQRIIQTDRQGIIHLEFCTVCYTRSMYLSVFLKRRKDILKSLDELLPIIYKLKKDLNSCKTTKVKTFILRPVNIRCQGSFERRIDLHIFDYIGVPPGYTLYHTEKKGTQHAIPTQKPLNQINLSSVKLVQGRSNNIHFYFTGSFSIVTKSFNSLNIITDTLLWLDSQL